MATGAAAVALRCHVADSPDRRAASALHVCGAQPRSWTLAYGSAVRATGELTEDQVAQLQRDDGRSWWTSGTDAKPPANAMDEVRHRQDLSWTAQTPAVIPSAGHVEQAAGRAAPPDRIRTAGTSSRIAANQGPVMAVGGGHPIASALGDWMEFASRHVDGARGPRFELGQGGLAARVDVGTDGVPAARCACSMSWPSRSMACW
jgi:hypothetical protein